MSDYDLRQHLRLVEAQIEEARSTRQTSLLRNLQRERRAILDALPADSKPAK